MLLWYCECNDSCTLKKKQHHYQSWLSVLGIQGADFEAGEWGIFLSVIVLPPPRVVNMQYNQKVTCNAGKKCPTNCVTAFKNCTAWMFWRVFRESSDWRPVTGGLFSSSHSLFSLFVQKENTKITDFCLLTILSTFYHPILHFYSSPSLI